MSIAALKSLFGKSKTEMKIQQEESHSSVWESVLSSKKTDQEIKSENFLK